MSGAVTCCCSASIVIAVVLHSEAFFAAEQVHYIRLMDRRPAQGEHLMKADVLKQVKLNMFRNTPSATQGSKDQRGHAFDHADHECWRQPARAHLLQAAWMV